MNKTVISIFTSDFQRFLLWQMEVVKVQWGLSPPWGVWYLQGSGSTGVSQPGQARGQPQARGMSKAGAWLSSQQSISLVLGQNQPH